MSSALRSSLQATVEVLLRHSEIPSIKYLNKIYETSPPMSLAFIFKVALSFIW